MKHYVIGRHVIPGALIVCILSSLLCGCSTTLSVGSPKTPTSLPTTIVPSTVPTIPSTIVPSIVPTIPPTAKPAMVNCGLNKIAFDSDQDGNSEIYVMNADGSGVQRLTNNSAYDSNPTWSPDGNRIAFLSRRDGSNWEIYVMNADGTGVKNLSNKLAGSAGDFNPAWSPDGSRIAFNSGRDGSDYEIYVMNADLTGLLNLTNNLAYDSNPAWSPACK